MMQNKTLKVIEAHLSASWLLPIACVISFLFPVHAEEQEVGVVTSDPLSVEIIDEEVESKGELLLVEEAPDEVSLNTELASNEPISNTEELDSEASSESLESEDLVVIDSGNTSREELGPVIAKKAEPHKKQAGPVIFQSPESWKPSIVPFLSDWNTQTLDLNLLAEPVKRKELPSPISEVDRNPPQPMIAILIDDLGYSRLGMEASLELPKEVALAILPATPFAKKTALVSEQQQRITLLHAPMENQREMKLGPGGLYQEMSEEELKAALVENLEGLPGVLGVNNHMGSLLTTKENAMTWVMEVLQGRSLFFIDSLTSADSVAGDIAKEHGLKTVTRDVFLDNIRTKDAIDRQFNRLLKHARRYGVGLAIGHPYPETMSYLKERLGLIDMDGVQLIPITDLLIEN